MASARPGNWLVTRVQSIELVVGNPEGLHARPAAELIRVATESGCKVTIAKHGLAPVAASSILGLLALGVRTGERVTLTVDGEGEQLAVDQLIRVLSA